VGLSRDCATVADCYRSRPQLSWLRAATRRTDGRAVVISRLSGSIRDGDDRYGRADVRATALYREVLGVEPYAAFSQYVGFRIGDQEIGLDPNGHTKGMNGPIGYVEVDDIEARLRAFIEAGARERQGVTDVGGGKLMAWVEDADGNLIGLQQAAPGDK